jgi:hypothetical protein
VAHGDPDQGRCAAILLSGRRVKIIAHLRVGNEMHRNGGISGHLHCLQASETSPMTVTKRPRNRNAPWSRQTRKIRLQDERAIDSWLFGERGCSLDFRRRFDWACIEA